MDYPTSEMRLTCLSTKLPCLHSVPLNMHVKDFLEEPRKFRFSLSDCSLLIVLEFYEIVEEVLSLSCACKATTISFLFYFFVFGNLLFVSFDSNSPSSELSS